MCIQEKLKMCKFPLKASVQKFMQKFLCNLLAFVMAFQRSIKYWNPMTGSRSNYRFRPGEGKIRYLGSMPENLGSRYKRPAF